MSKTLSPIGSFFMPVRTPLIRVSTLAITASMVLFACGENAEDNNANNSSNNTSAATNNETSQTTNNPTTNNTTPTPEPLAVAGMWFEAFKGGQSSFPVEITQESWGSGILVSWDNDARVAITQNPEDSSFDPGKFNRIVWTEPGTSGAFYYCTTDFGVETQEAAEALTTMADATEAYSSGCGGFGWSKLVPQAFELSGIYVATFSGAMENYVEIVTEGEWNGFEVIDFDNGENTAITRNGPDADFMPGSYNKIVWTELENGEFFHCTVEFGLESEQAARDSVATADDSNPFESGCGNFGWTKNYAPVEVEGTWDATFKGGEMASTEVITPIDWNGQILVDHDNEANVAYTRNRPDAQFGPDLYNKIVWTELENGEFFYCSIAFGLETLDAARADMTMADDTDPFEGGCGNFGWTKMSPPQEQ